MCDADTDGGPDMVDDGFRLSDDHRNLGEWAKRLVGYISLSIVMLTDLSRTS